MNNNPTKRPFVFPNPFTHFCQSIGAIPTSYQDSLDYYETLLWLIKFLENTVIPAVNTNSEAVDELQGFYLQLQSYVNNYFDNLDVQEEINNKLDAMVEDGTLQEIIADYLNSKAIFCFDNVNSMKNSTNLIDGSYARTLGYHSINDGGGSLYKIREITNSDVVDEMTIIAIGEDDLIGELIYSDVIVPEQLGAYGDGVTDDSQAFNVAMQKNNIELLNKNYFLSTEITINNEININGNGATIKGNGFKLNNKAIIKNLNFKNINYNAISYRGNYLYIDNCKFEDIGIANNLDASYQGAGVYSSNENEKVFLNITNSYFKHCYCHSALFIAYNHDISIKNNSFIDNFYRAIQLFGNVNTYNISGIIENNYINGCGRINTTNSGVGCNGIYSVCGFDVNILINKISDCLENGIEGVYKSIIGNIIDNTNYDLTNHPTPSIEGIYITSSGDCIIKDNKFKNVRKYGISHYSDTSSYNTRIIKNNIFESIIPVDNVHFSMYINEPQVNNYNILDNLVNDEIFINNPQTNCFYSGDITKLNYIGQFNVISNYNNNYNYIKNFNNLDDFTYSNCTPTIITDTDLSKKVVTWSQAQYNRLVGPLLPKLEKASFKLNMYVKGHIKIDIMKNGLYYKTLLNVNNNDYDLVKLQDFLVANITDELNFWFVAVEGDVSILNVNYSIQYF